MPFPRWLPRRIFQALGTAVDNRTLAFPPMCLLHRPHQPDPSTSGGGRGGRGPAGPCPPPHAPIFKMMKQAPKSKTTLLVSGVMFADHLRKIGLGQLLESDLYWREEKSLWVPFLHATEKQKKSKRPRMKRRAKTRAGGFYTPDAEAGAVLQT